MRSKGSVIIRNVMPLESVHIERVKLKDLPALAETVIKAAAPGSFIPITKHRAAAHTYNPNASPVDVALLLAKAGERNVGYFGLMPVMLRHEGELHKVYWLTTWAVAPEYLGRGLGSQLMEAALALDVDLAIVGSKPARRVSSKYGFSEAKSLEYVQIDLGLAGRYNPISLILHLMRKALSLFDVRINIERLDLALGRFFDLIFAPVLRPLLTNWLMRRVGRPARSVSMQRVQQVQAVSESPADGPGFYRSLEVINWMLAHPWVLPSGLSESEHLDYSFTDARPGFELSGWQVSAANGEQLGFICFQTSLIDGRRVVKVLDHQFPPSAPGDLLLELALQHARRVRADLIEGSSELAAPLGSGVPARLLVRRRQRVCQVHPRTADSPLARARHQLEQTYCDGDMAFT